jgi:hypothetical protein
VEQEDTLLTIFSTVSVTHKAVPSTHDMKNAMRKVTDHRPSTPYASSGIMSKSFKLFIRVISVGVVSPGIEPE